MEDSGLPSMDSKDVEDIFKGVLVEESQDNSFPKTTNISTVQSKPTLPSGLPVPGPAVPNPALIQGTSMLTCLRNVFLLCYLYYLFFTFQLNQILV